MRLKLSLICCLVFCAKIVNAEAFILDLAFGYGNLGLEQRFVPEELEFLGSSENVAGYSIHLGYQWDNNIVADLGFDAAIQDIFGAGDSVTFFSRNLALGYMFAEDEKVGVYFLPQIGVSSWSFTFEEGAFLNPGPEAESRHDGSDLFFKPTIGWRLPSGSDFYLSYKYLGTEVADFNGFTAGIKIAF